MPKRNYILNGITTLALLALAGCSKLPESSNSIFPISISPEYPTQSFENLCYGSQRLTLPSGRVINTYEQCGQAIIAINNIGEAEELGASSKLLIAPQLDMVTFLDENAQPVTGSLFKVYELYVHPDLNDCETDWLVYKELTLHAISIDILRSLGIIDYTFELFPPEEFDNKAQRILTGLADSIASDLLAQEFSKEQKFNSQCIRLELNIQEMQTIFNGNRLQSFMEDGTLTEREFTTLLDGYIRLTEEYTNNAFKKDLIEFQDAIGDN